MTMILSHRHRFVFIKTHKSAGTSIEIALSRYCGERDIITPIGDEDLRLACGGRPPQNYFRPGLFGWVDRLARRRHRPRGSFWNHMTAARVRENVGAEVWESYYKICFERNPWDKVISAYWFFFERNASRDGLKRFIMDGSAVRGVSDWRRYTDASGRLLVDHVARYESLQSELAELSGRLGLPPLELPRAKGGFRRDRRHYSEVLDSEERDRIAQDFAREIAAFNYVY